MTPAKRAVPAEPRIALPEALASKATLPDDVLTMRFALRLENAGVQALTLDREAAEAGGYQWMPDGRLTSTDPVEMPWWRLAIDLFTGADLLLRHLDGVIDLTDAESWPERLLVAHAIAMLDVENPDLLDINP